MEAADALVRYAYHDDDCAYMTCTWKVGVPRAQCSCGYDEAARQFQAVKKGDGTA